MRSILALLAVFLMSPGIFALNEPDGENREAVKSGSGGYAVINGVKLYYEIHGTGEPLLYLHGGLSSSRDIDAYLPELSKKFKVVTVDRRGHGRSPDTDEAYSYFDMAESMNAFLDWLEIPCAYVMGWSDGGVVGYHLASRHPAKVKKLIAAGANYLVGGMTRPSIDWITTRMTVENLAKDYPGVEKIYREQNPDPGRFPDFIRKTREMWLRDPYLARTGFEKIAVPVLLVAGDRDDITLEHMIEMHRLLKNSRLCILPETGHFVFNRYDEVVAGIIVRFLER